MNRGLGLKKIWSDNELLELKVDVSDGISYVSTQVYIDHIKLTEVIAALEKFKDQLHGGILDIRFGEFGPEFANGAFHCRLHFAQPGKLYVTM